MCVICQMSQKKKNSEKLLQKTTASEKKKIRASIASLGNLKLKLPTQTVPGVTYFQFVDCSSSEPTRQEDLDPHSGFWCCRNDPSQARNAPSDRYVRCQYPCQWQRRYSCAVVVVVVLQLCPCPIASGCMSVRCFVHVQCLLLGPATLRVRTSGPVPPRLQLLCPVR